MPPFVISSSSCVITECLRTYTKPHKSKDGVNHTSARVESKGRGDGGAYSQSAGCQQLFHRCDVHIVHLGEVQRLAASRGCHRAARALHEEALQRVDLLFLK